MRERLKILLVEDNILNQRIVTLSLKKFDHEVIIANNGVEAIDHFKQRNFDVVLMDIMMPVMDGLEATVKIRELENMNNSKRRTPIIALTANTLDNDREKCLSFGMDEFMTKPFDIEILNSIFFELKIVS